MVENQTKVDGSTNLWALTTSEDWAGMDGGGIEVALTSCAASQE